MQPYFANGDATIIALAKARYRRDYKAKWNKENRSKCKEITIRLNKEEFKEIQEQARLHVRKLAPFIKQATIAQVRKIYIVPNDERINKILQLLKMIYIKVEDLENDELGNKVFLVAMAKLETEIRQCLISPMDLNREIQKYIDSNNLKLVSNDH